jgi:hypothetical protein
MVASPKSLEVLGDSIPAAASSYQHKDESCKSSDPVHNACGLDTRELVKKTEDVAGNHEAPIIEDYQDAARTST